MTDAIKPYLDHLERFFRLQDDTFKVLSARYDEAMKRILDLQAELEYLRQEVNRK